MSRYDIDRLHKLTVCSLIYSFIGFQQDFPYFLSSFTLFLAYIYYSVFYIILLFDSMCTRCISLQAHYCTSETKKKTVSVWISNILWVSNQIVQVLLTIFPIKIYLNIHIVPCKIPVGTMTVHVQQYYYLQGYPMWWKIMKSIAEPNASNKTPQYLFRV